MPFAFIHRLPNRWLGRLSVGRKLMLIYLLDLTAVIFVSGILINEKFIAIDFARKELRGNAYIADVRAALTDAALLGSGLEARRAALPVHLATLAAAEVALGQGFNSAGLNESLRAALSKNLALPPLSAPSGSPAVQIAQALESGTLLLTRVGNQSNLILDPDLDSYYTMSLIVLRYPELLEVVHGLRMRLDEGLRSGPPSAELRAHYAVLEGRLEASARAIARDHAEAYAAGDLALQTALKPRERALLNAIDSFQTAALAATTAGASAADAALAFAAAAAAERALLLEVEQAWAGAGVSLDHLLQARIRASYQRMGLHLGTALALLLAILAVVTLVARSIARPLRHLAAVAEEVSLSGNAQLRAQGQGSDETARVIAAFNDMLDQLGHEREVQKELAATARAADAQRELVQATPIALVVTAIPGHEVLHANPPAERWLAGRNTDPWKLGMEPAVRARFFQQLADRGGVDEFEVRWQKT